MTAGRVRCRLCWAIPLATVAGVMTFPSSASAHAGQTDPVASSYRATITSVAPGVTAKVVDGDQRLWMSADPRLTVIVVGRFGEPYLRFSSAGVDENLRSPTTYLNRATPVMVPCGAKPKLPPAWKHLSGSHAYIWHEDRLHVLAGRSSAPGEVGPWVVPLTVDGRRGGDSRPALARGRPVVVVVLAAGGDPGLRRRAAARTGSADHPRYGQGSGAGRNSGAGGGDGSASSSTGTRASPPGSTSTSP